jgi:hypothetical protein
LLKNVIRINTSLSEGGLYEHMNEEGVWLDDDRFRENNIPVKAIATSTAQRDAGMFELNFNDDRYLPFERAGAISEWKLELTQDADLRQFDHSTISDVVLHINYTAREDAGLFKENAVTYLKNFITNAAALRKEPFIRMFSLKHEFSTEWNKFLFPATAGADQLLSLTFVKEHFPFFVRDKNLVISKFEVFVKSIKEGDYKMIIAGKDVNDDPVESAEVPMPENSSFGNMQKCTIGTVSNSFIPDEIDIFKQIAIKFKHNSKIDYHSI